MLVRVRIPAAALATALLASACVPGEETPTPPAEFTINATPAQTIADGSAVAIEIPADAKPPVAVTTTLGTFQESGTQTVSVAAVPEVVHLATCDSSVDETCAGQASVRATDSNLARATILVTFRGLEICADGKDNSGDGLADCADPACPAGTACNGTGKVCGGSTCSVCTGNGGVAEPAMENSCGDAADNDCDGKVDCADPDCANDVCLTANNVTGTCKAGTATAPATCVCTPVGSTENACGDGLDNDCDGKKDCEDDNCQPGGAATSKTCNTALGLVCSAPGASGAGACTVCPGGSGPETLCSDGADNDCDGQADCADASCGDLTCAANGKLCDDVTRLCACPSGQANELSDQCGDALDNDCDGKTDCQDSDCQLAGGQSCGAFGLKCRSTGTGAAATWSCSCPGSAEVCNAAGDEDCDGFVNCEDTACHPVGNALGAICDGLGNTCSSPQLGPSACTVCGGNGGNREQGGELTCGDGKDNDCDGIADCQDASCATRVCDTTLSKSCDAGTLQCVCPSGQTAELATQCGDGVDNDCDGKKDCADTDCGGRSCGPNNLTCTTGASPTCACTVPGGTVQSAGETTCNDGKDNDCDGLVDCQETACQPGAGAGKACDTYGNICSAGGTCSVCTVSGGVVEQGGEATCGDGKDNDCDGLLDCADTSCAGVTCGGGNGRACNGTTHVCECTGNGGAVEVAEATCGDGGDNDCDGKIDCQDTDCTGDACGLNGRVCSGGTTPACVCSGNGGTAQASEAACGDGKDNDCDGLADCDDTQCRPVGNLPGQVCDALGHTCSPPVAGTSRCTICSGNGGTAEGAEISCGDGKDNDCDSFVDCQDDGCDALACTSSGKRCVGAELVCRCLGAEANAEVTCNDGQDNDCDGQPDCKDTDCQPLAGNPADVCGPNGMQCSATGGGTCACAGNGGTPQATESSCDDGKDNDCDGLADCADPNCRPTVAGEFGTKSCALGASAAKRCDIVGDCVCPLGETLGEVTCGDLADNDCDGLIDCNDPDCLGDSCSATGKACSVTSPVGCTCPGTAEVCNAAGDEDCDGLADCADGECLDRQCNAALPTYYCKGTHPTLVCKDISSEYALVLTALPNRIPANGAATSAVTAKLTRDQGGGPQPVQGVTITFASSDPGVAISPTSSATDSSGQVTVTVTSSAAGVLAGVATITGTYDTGTQLVKGSTGIQMPTLGQLKFVSQQYSVLGARFSSFQETSQLTFQLLDTANQTYPPGVTVQFTHQPLGESFIGTTPDCPTATLCRASGVTDANGFVRVVLRSGKVANVVSVVASAEAGGSGPITATASNIAIVGAKASGKHISVNCTPQNVPALTQHDCSTSSYAGPDGLITCTAFFADRFQNVLGVATLATFNSEAGAAGPPASTAAYDPLKTPSAQTTLGQAVDYVAVRGYSLPADVEPYLDPADEYRTPLIDLGCGPRVHNPRDGLSTIIVTANGEEGFVDGSNGKPADGQYNLGEYFIDIGEPFVDKNDNGTRDDDEPYTDFNNSGAWDPPNGQWDANTTIWAETRVVYTGYPAGYAIESSPGVWEQWFSRWYDWSSGQPPAPTPVPTFSVVAQFDGPPQLPPTTDTLGVVFTDENFNRPTRLAAYGIVVATGKVTVKYTDSPAAPDHLGMNFIQRFCDAPASSNCDNVCRFSPCYVVTDVSGFSYGTWGTAAITGGTDPSYPNEVQSTSTINGVMTVLPVYGTNE